jgi:hypothetical protein
MASPKRFIARHGLNNNNHTITNVATPVNDTDVATKASVIANIATDNLDKLITGIISGGEVTLNANTTLIDISAAVYYIQGVKYTYAGATGLSSSIGAGQSSRRFGLTTTGLVNQQSNFTSAQKQTILPIARVQNVQGATGSGQTLNPPIDTRFLISEEGYNQRLWQEEAIGVLYYTGGIITESGTALQLNESSGSFYDAQRKKQNITGSSNIEAIKVYHVAGVDTYSTKATLVVPNTQYDNGTDLVTAANNKWLNHTLLKSPREGNEFFLVYSNAEYTSQATAEAALPSYGVFANQATSGLIAVAQLIIQKSASSIARIKDIRPFIGGTVGATLGTSNLQQTYDNSTNPEIVTDAQRGALTIKAGVSNTDNILEVQNLTGNTRLFATGNGSLNIGEGVGTEDVVLSLGNGRTGNGYAIIDLVGDATNTDYALRLVRGAGGTNADSSIHHAGTGNFNITTDGQANLKLRTNSADRLTIDGTTGAVSFGKAGGGALQANGAVTSWGVTYGVDTGALNVVMGVASSATWAISSTSAGTFRFGIQSLDAGGQTRYYTGASYFEHNSSGYLTNLSGINNVTATKLSYLENVTSDIQAQINAAGGGSSVVDGFLQSPSANGAWTARTSSENSVWESVAYGNGTYIAVASSTSGVYKCMTSSDGQTWIDNTILPTSKNWSGIAYGNGVWIAVATTGAGRIHYSTNILSSFPLVSNSIGIVCTSVAYGNNTFVVVTTTSAVRIISDASPSNSTSAVGNSGVWNEVAFGNGKFISVGDGGLIQYSTDNGNSWSIATAPAGTETHNFKCVTYAAGKFVALGSGVSTNPVIYSTDGITWTAVLTGPGTTSTSWNSVTHDGVVFVAIGYKAGSTQVVATSSDAITWTLIASGQVADIQWNGIVKGPDKLVAVASNSVITAPTTQLNLPAISNPSTVTIGSSSKTVSAGATTAYTLAEIGAASTSHTHSSDALATWVSASITAKDWRWVDYDPTYGFVAVTADQTTSSISTSPDGFTWTHRTTPNAGFTKVVRGSDKWVALGSIGGAEIAYSTDGTTWTGASIGSTSYWGFLAYGNGIYVAGVYSLFGNNVATSTDGISWTSTNNGPLGTMTGLCFGAGLFVAISSNTIYTSTDGVTWTSSTSPENATWRCVCWGNGLFVALGSSGSNRVMTSPDGITWTIRTASALNTWLAITYGNGMFVGVSGATSNSIMTSPDGITWTSRVAPEFNTWYSVTYGNGLYISLANSGTNRLMSSGGLSRSPVRLGNIGYMPQVSKSTTQTTSKSTAVVLHSLCGTITTTADALASLTSVSFTLTNAEITPTDNVVINHASGGTSGAYMIGASNIQNESCVITLFNITGGALAEALVLKYSIIR